jgi:pimeloyl-ACP methyl ester carboxylesterase
LRMIIDGVYTPAALVLMSNRLHRPAPFAGRRSAWRFVTGLGTVPGADLVLSHATKAVFRPRFAERLSAQRNPEARDLVRHAFADVGGNTNRARAWARFAARWPGGAQRELFDLYPSLQMPVMLLWADEDHMHPLAVAEEAVDLIPDAILRVLPNTGYLIAYDDPAGVARELGAFCG